MGIVMGGGVVINYICEDSVQSVYSVYPYCEYSQSWKLYFQCEEGLKIMSSVYSMPCDKI